MPSLTAQLQRDNARLTTQCETLKTELAALQQRYQVLSRSEARYRQVVENSPISISFLSVDGQHVEANAAFERMMGFTVEDSQRVGFNVFTDPALEENGTRPYMLRAMAGETVIEPPTNFYDASQLYGKKAVENYIPGQGHYFPIWNEDGEVQEIVEMSPMVTDLLQSQAEAQAERERAAQERAKLLSTVAQVANLLLRSQDYTAVLPEVVRLLGEVVGSDRCAITQELPASANQPHRVRLLTEWHREEVASVLTGSPEFGSGVEIDIPSSFHQPLLQGDAINFVVSEVAEPDWRAFFEAHDNVSMLIVPIMLADGCWGHIGFDNCQDARLFDEAEIAILQVAAESIAAAIERQQQDEALRESEKRYRTLFELSSEGIYRFELEPPLPLALSPEERMELGYQVNQIVEVNHAFVEQYGCDTPEDLVGTKIGDFYDHEYSQANDQVNLDLVRDLRVSKIETVETDRLGNRHWFISSVVCDVRDDAIVGGWGVQTDITELKQTQQSLLEAEQARALELERYNTELKQAVEQLQSRDRVLQATATAADALLTTGNLEEAVNTALQIIGESLDTDRIAVLENEPYETVSDLSQVKWELLYEWHSSYIFSQLQSPEHKKGTFAGIETWPERLAQGESISYPLEALPEPFRSKMAEVGVQSIHEVPIFVEGQCWGALGIDDCRETKHRDPAELAVLKTAAACIGSAIERERLRLAELRTQQALLKAQQDRVAELVKTNQALKNSLDRLAAAPDLEAFLGYVLTEISQQFDGKTASLHLFDPDNQTLHLHQWVAQGRVYSKQEFHQFGPLAEPIVVTGSTAWAFLQQHKFPLVINRDNAHQYLFPGTKDWQLDWAEREELQSGINILLSSGETPLGMLCMFSASRSTFTSEELEIAQALSHQATLAIQLTQLAAEAQQSAVLGERNRLARDIHDTLAQSLGGIVLHLQAADSIYTTELQDKQTHVTQARQLAKQALSEARRSVQALRPQLLEQTTLDQAINSLLQQLTSHSPLQITYQLHGSPYGLPPEVEAHLLRISREAITNSLRHAQATELVVDFTYEPRQVQLRIQDNGQGFDTTLPTFGYGLITMQERAQQISARLHLSSQRGQGTIVQVTLPIATAVTGAFYD